MVGKAGLEPAISRTPSERSTSEPLPVVHLKGLLLLYHSLSKSSSVSLISVSSFTSVRGELLPLFWEGN